jgi:ATPase family associated with various cellular activities (AAA)
MSHKNFDGGERMKKDKILIIGDWFIDENWLMAKTDNYNSTDVGEAHYSSLVKGPANFVLSVCGVASVLKILSGDGQYPEHNENGQKNPQKENSNKSIISKYDLVGVGAWNPRDTKIIQRILCAKDAQKKFMTPYTLDNNLKSLAKECEGRQAPIECKTCKLKNYNLINLVEFEPDSDKPISTNRVYRVYEGFGSQKPKLKYRFDWQIDLRSKFINKNWHHDVGDNVKAVILVDHGKGVITDDLIDILLKKYGNAKWYVRNKLKSPSWFKKLVEDKKKKLQLLVVDQQLVNHTYGLRTWQRNGSLCRASLEFLGENLGLEIFEHGESKDSNTILSENTAVLFENNWAIGASRKKNNPDNARVYYFPRLTEKERYIRVGRTSIFFNSLIYWDLMKGGLDSEIEMAENTNEDKNQLSKESHLSIATVWALKNMEKWMDECTEAWAEMHERALSGPFADVIGWHPIDNKFYLPDRIIQGEDYSHSWGKWNLSSKDVGIITNSEGEKEFHLWRSYGTLDRYVCPGGTKRSRINELVQALQIFRSNKNPKVPLNTLLVAEPGWGKSYLAKCLSNHFDFNYLSYSIAQMSSTKELVDSFKEISSIQKQSDNPCLVFMDEIDAEISGNSVLGLLLSPMWDGVFKSEGYTNKIDPCVWIFAGTKSQETMTSYPKGRDFVSRINGPVIDIDFLNEANRTELNRIGILGGPQTEKERLEKLVNAIRDRNVGNERTTEIVYQTVNLLNLEYGPITKIEERVLNLFSNILPLNGVRSLKIFVTNFRYIKKGIIRKENVPPLKNTAKGTSGQKTLMEKQIEVIDMQKYREDFLNCENEEKVKILLNVPI